MIRKMTKKSSENDSSPIDTGVTGLLTQAWMIWSRSSAAAGGIGDDGPQAVLADGAQGEVSRHLVAHHASACHPRPRDGVRRDGGLA